MERINCYCLLAEGYGTEKDFGTGVRFSQSLKTPVFKKTPNRRYKKGRRFFGVLNFMFIITVLR